MAKITICGIDGGPGRRPRVRAVMEFVKSAWRRLKRRLHVRAVGHGRSTEEAAREIPRQAVGKQAGPANLGEAIRRRFAALGGVDLDLPPRESMPEPPRFD